MDYADIAVLIPAYQPDERLTELVEALVPSGFRVTVVDDGSGESFAPIFVAAEVAGARVIRYANNRGKGAALRTGIERIMEDDGVSIVTADSDGQHTPEDIRKIADALRVSNDALILGTRDKSAMPARSRAGNTITAFLFGLLTSMWIEDTQTGLRGLPASCLNGLVRLEGDRYEYEMNMLLYACHMQIKVESVPISTIYIDNNRGTHFHGLRDGARIYGLLFRQILKFMGSSFVASIVDTGVYTILQLLYPNYVFLSIGVARLLSSSINYVINRKVVFNVRRKPSMFFGYLLLVAFILVSNYFLIRLFKSFGVSFFTSKILADLILFFINYKIQHRVIFRKSQQAEE